MLDARYWIKQAIQTPASRNQHRASSVQHLKLWITDFGLARLESDAGMTMTGDILGTLRYMSPEQALAKRVVVDHRSDIYSLGVTLYELFTLQPAFTGDDRQELLRQIAFEEPLGPRQINSRIPQDLQTILLKAIEKNPAQRYATARDVAIDLRNFVEHQPIKAKPPTWRDVTLKWARRHPVGLRAAVTTSCISAIILAACVGWVFRDHAARQTILEEQVKLSLDEADTWHQAGKLVEALSAIKRAEGFLASGDGTEELRKAVNQFRLNLETVHRLDGIWSERTDFESADRAYSDVFRVYGINVKEISPEEAAGRIQKSLIRDALIAALDDWFEAQSTDGSDEQDTRRPLERLRIARLADADAWRNQVRGAIESGDDASLLRLISENDVADQPPSFTILLARALQRGNQLPEAVNLLKQAQWQHPDDFYINIELATCLRNATPPRTEEAIGYRRVAVALRPDSYAAYNHLALPLWVTGKLDEAELAYRESTRLVPNEPHSYFSLFILLWDQGRREEAEAIFHDAPPPDNGYRTLQ